MTMSCLLSYILWEDRNMVSEVGFEPTPPFGDQNLSLDDSATTEMAYSNLPVPIAMNMKGDVTSNWEFF